MILQAILRNDIVEFNYTNEHISIFQLLAKSI